MSEYLGSPQGLEEFELDGADLEVTLTDVSPVKEGVECYTYAFVKDASKDLAIVRVNNGYKTPKQKVLQGIKTLEGFVSGEGTLTVVKPSGEVSTYEYGYNYTEQSDPVEVHVGEIMQWCASRGVELVFYEVCEPPFQEGRFENLPE